MTVVKYVSKSQNSKLGNRPVDSTYAPIAATCPNSCSLKGNGCYAENSHVGIIVSRLNRASMGMSALQVAREEAKAIDQAYDGGSVPLGRDMRLHVSGDSRTIKGSRLINI